MFSYEQPAPVPQFGFLDPGLEPAVLDVQFCGGSGSNPYNELGFKAVTVDNFQYDYAFAPSREPRLGSGDVIAGTCKRGFVTLDVPVGQRPVSIVWDYPGWQQVRWTVPPA